MRISSSPHTEQTTEERGSVGTATDQTGISAVSNLGTTVSLLTFIGFIQGTVQRVDKGPKGLRVLRTGL